MRADVMDTFLKAAILAVPFWALLLFAVLTLTSCAERRDGDLSPAQWGFISKQVGK